MTEKSAYIVQYRRKRKGLTNYQKRLKLLKSGKLRLVVRKSANAAQCQIVQYNERGDRTLVSASSLELPKYGYKGHTGNIPAAYLAGLMCGLRARKKGINEAILDTGLYITTKGSRIFAALKGAIDAGLKINAAEKNFPGERRIQGYHIAEFGRLLSAEKPEEYEKIFFKVLERKLEPEKFSEHFEEVKRRIKGEFA